MNSDYSNEIQNFNIQQLYLRQFQALKMQKKVLTNLLYS